LNRILLLSIASALLLANTPMPALAQEAMANDFIGKFRAWVVLDLRFALATLEGRTVYAYAHDGPWQPAYFDVCEQAWFPVAAIPQDVAFEPFSIFMRADGTRQWAYSGVPLYTSARDARPGEANGNGVDGLWHIVEIPAHTME